MGNSSDSTVARGVGLRWQFSRLHATDSPAASSSPACGCAPVSLALRPMAEATMATPDDAAARIGLGVATPGTRCLR